MAASVEKINPKEEMNHSKQNTQSANKDPDAQEGPVLEWLIPAAVRLFDERKQLTDLIERQRYEFYIESNLTIH